MDSVATVRAYYETIDTGAYEELRALLAEGFVQRRPDRRFDGPDRFVAFMRDERPQTDTTHDLDCLYVTTAGDGTDVVDDEVDAVGDGADAVEDETDAVDGTADRDGEETEVAARGRLLTAEEALLARYVDVFVVSADGIERLDTYTR